MNIHSLLVNLEKDASLAITSDHMARLIAIGFHIAEVYGAGDDCDFMDDLKVMEEYYNTWGVCHDTFWIMHGRCMEIVGPANAEITETFDRGVEVSS